MSEVKSRKKPKKASIYACYFHEEAIKAIGFLGFIGQMANYIDFARHKAASALHKIHSITKDGLQKKQEVPAPVFQPVTTKTLEQFDEYMSSLVFIQMVDQVNGYVGNILRHIFSQNPSMMKSSRTITLEKVLSYSDISILHAELAEDYIQTLMYKSARELFKHLGDMHGIHPFSDTKDLDLYVDFNLKRNLLVHNSGKINKLFLSKCTNPEAYVLGSKLKISVNDTLNAIPESLGLVLGLDKYLCEKFNINKRLLPSKKVRSKWASFLNQKRKRRSSKVSTK